MVRVGVNRYQGLLPGGGRPRNGASSGQGEVVTPSPSQDKFIPHTSADPTSMILQVTGNKDSRQNSGLIKRALAQRWPIKPSLKEKLLERAREWLESGLLSAKEQASWAKVIVMAEAQNQQDEQKQEEYDRLDAGKLTANQGHTLILDGPIRSQVIAAAIASLPSTISQVPDGPIRPQGEAPKLLPESQSQLPPPSFKENLG